MPPSHRLTRSIFTFCAALCAAGAGPSTQPTTAPVATSGDVSISLRVSEAGDKRYAEVTMLNTSGKTVQVPRSPSMVSIVPQNRKTSAPTSRVLADGTIEYQTTIESGSGYLIRGPDKETVTLRPGEGFIKRVSVVPSSEKLESGDYTLSVSMSGKFHDLKPPTTRFTVPQSP